MDTQINLLKKYKIFVIYKKQNPNWVKKHNKNNENISHSIT